MQKLTIGAWVITFQDFAVNSDSLCDILDLFHILDLPTASHFVSADRNSWLKAYRIHSYIWSYTELTLRQINVQMEWSENMSQQSWRNLMKTLQYYRNCSKPHYMCSDLFWVSIIVLEYTLSLLNCLQNAVGVRLIVVWIW